MHRIALVLAALTLLTHCAPKEEAPMADGGTPVASYEQQIEEWKKTRAANLTRDTGWLSLTGLFWLESGPNQLGSADGIAVMLPKGKAPENAGTLDLEGETVTLSPEPDSGLTIDGKPVTARTVLAPDVSGKPTLVESGPVQFFVIRRGDRIGVRVRDRESDALKHFEGLDYFPVDEKYRVEATLERYQPAKEIPIQNIIGIVEPAASPGALVFTIDGTEYRLDPIVEEGSDELFVIFADKTSGVETYGAGRYLYAAMPGPDGKTTLDFNKAYNPPCAFTDFATCPLPPRQNRLEVRIEAGEKKYEVAGH